jgi:hypothetical protein
MTSNWYSFNDSYVEHIKKTKIDEISSEATPYILVYVRTDCIGNFLD